MTSRNRDELFERLAACQSRLERLISVLLPSPADVDDVVQQTLVTAWEKIETFDETSLDGDGFFAWLSTIAVNHTRNRVRAIGRDRHVFSAETISVLAAESTQRASLWPSRERALRVCLSELPNDDRDLVGRCYASDSSTQQVAAKLGRSATSVYRSLRRIRRVLQSCIDRKLAEVS